MFFDTIEWHILRKREVNADEDIQDILLALDKDSFYIYEGFMQKEELSELKINIQNKFNDIKNTPDVDKNLHSYNMVHDKVRWATVDQYVDLANKYKNNTFILKVAEKFHNENIQVLKTTYDVKHFNLEQEKGGLSEIELGDHIWHIDRPYGVLKTMLLLEDVTDDDGPFEIISGSHRPFSDGALRFFNWLKIFICYYCFDLGYGPYAEPGHESIYFNTNKLTRLRGNAGDLIFINTAAWHRGPQLSLQGYREVLWNYIYGQNKLSRNIVLRKILGKSKL
jgi:hypothetical protein